MEIKIKIKSHGKSWEVAGYNPQRRATAEMNRANGNSAIEQVLRKITHCTQGQMKIQRWHISKAVKSNAHKKEIGARRADKIWGWVATRTDRKEHTLKSKEAWKQDWISAGERSILVARAEAAWGEGEGAGTRATKAELEGAVLTWVEENEEPQMEGPWRLRPPKLTQMLAARKAMAKTRGGRPAIYATLANLTAQNRLTLTQTPNKPNNKGPWKDWIKDSARWMRQQGWIQTEAEESEVAETAKQNSLDQQPGQYLAIDVGEGWGSVRRALQALPEVEVMGVDRRQHTNTGKKHGVITAAIHHDLTDKGKMDLISTIAKKAGRAAKNWTLLWMSLECSPMSIANAINQASGTAHGKWANSEQNQSYATQERTEQEEQYLQEAMTTLENVIEALEAHPDLAFALENPATSQTWKLTPLVRAMERNPHWKLIRVDQCAYGRKSQKPTCILTNLKTWTPKGQTGNGRCVIRECGGTKDNQQGDRRHAEQTVPNSKERRPTQGQKTGGRWDFTKEAVVNAVAESLVTEIMEAAIRQKLNATETK